MLNCYGIILGGLTGFALSAPGLSQPAEDAAPAPAVPKGTLSVLVENDKFTGTDRHYTNGLLISYLSGKDRVPGWLRTASSFLPGVEDDTVLRAGYVLGQSIFTPDDTDTLEPLPNQRPYAAWLYGGVALVAETNDRLDTWELDLGIVGPSARGEEIQNGFHHLIGVEEAQGWNNQLEDEFGVLLTFERKWRNGWEYQRTGYGIDMTPHVGAGIGNIASFVNFGITFRLGNDLSNDFGAPRIHPSLPGSNFFVPRDEFGWYFFLGADARAVGHNIFLDGNTDKDSLSVDRELWVGDLQGGLVMNLFGSRLAYTYVYRTPEYEQQDDPDKFASISLSIKY